MARRQKVQKPRYSAEERFKYHQKRDVAPGRFGIERGGTKHMYSFGFSDAFCGPDMNNKGGVSDQFGEKAARAYEAGRKRGLKAAREYYETTGKQPFDLYYK